MPREPGYEREDAGQVPDAQHTAMGEPVKRWKKKGGEGAVVEFIFPSQEKQREKWAGLDLFLLADE